MHGIWDEWVAAFLSEERDAKGRRPRTIELHKENLTTMRAALDAVGAPTDPAELQGSHIVAAVVRGCPARVRPHRARHTFATAAAAAGVRPEILRRQLRHASEASLERYLHVTDPELLREMAAVQDRLYAPPRWVD